MNPDVTSNRVRKPEGAATEFETTAWYTLGAPGNSQKHQWDGTAPDLKAQHQEELNQAQLYCFCISLPLRAIKCFRSLKNHRKMKDVQNIIKSKKKNVFTKRNNAWQLFKCSLLRSLSPSAKNLCSPPSAISSIGTIQINMNLKFSSVKQTKAIRIGWLVVFCASPPPKKKCEKILWRIWDLCFSFKMLNQRKFNYSIWTRIIAL